MTKASFDTIGGLLIAFVAGNLAQYHYSVANWWMFALHVIFTVTGIWMFSNGYSNLPKKNKTMTPKELYDWAVERGAEDYDIMVDGDAIDYQLPEIDEQLKIIEIIR